MSNQYDHLNRPDAEWLKSLSFDQGGLIQLHRYGGQHDMVGTCHCHPLTLTVEEIYEPSVAALQARIDNFYRRQ